MKQLIKEKTGIEIANIRLIYGGHQLKDEGKLSDYKTIGDNAEIILVMRLPGGFATNSKKSIGDNNL